MSRLEETIHVFNVRAAEYAQRYENLEVYHDGFNFLCDQLSKKASVLDMACGPGNITKYFLKVRPDLNFLGIDLAPNMIEIARKENPEASFKVKDIRLIAELDEYFHAIIVGFAFPYLSFSEAETLIKNTYQQLMPNGLVYISTMEGDYNSSGYETTNDGKSKVYIYYHDPNSIKGLLIESGFNIIWEKQQPFIQNGKIRYNDYIVIGQKGG